MAAICQFMQECCLVAPNAQFPGLDLYLTYVYWCLQNEVPVQDQFTFADQLEGHGLQYRETEDSCYFRGIAVLPQYRIDPAESQDC